ncbi:cell wall-binding repeat-containing protein [Paraconexibacter algicola]|uniref:Cell wall-binding repeat-containing protein n=1 Tax=Paraconexibacter algicola TaxID=2133960 RepID=A0A2T4UFA6_9ACTN|nr:cell wall-binding repeat-containing protein [Paraconexibacter algicola]PTL56465.1 hypothetical protein C7Y72_16010 [Paraconexibacter algicola]
MLRPALPAALLVLALAAAGCGKGDGPATGSTTAAPAVGAKSDEKDAATDLGFPTFATKNTTRVGGGDAPTIAAAVARAVYPGGERGQRPAAVALAPAKDWRVALASASLMAPPVRAPLLLSDGDGPDVTVEALQALAPTGSAQAGGAQVVRVGDVFRPARLKTTDVGGRNPAAIARALDAFGRAVRGSDTGRVLVVSSDAPEYAMPAAAWAAKSGDPILFVTRTAVPAETLAALKTHSKPKIYVLGPSKVIGPAVTKALRATGTVTRIGDQDPVTNAIAFARYRDGEFGWGITDPGHGLVFAGTRRPADAGAAAALSASGTYGPLLLLARGDALPKPLEQFLLDIQPGYDRDPVRGVYNHGWIVGDDQAVETGVQATVDGLLEIAPVNAAAPEPTATTTQPTATTKAPPTRTTPTTTTTTPRSAP